MNFYHNVTFHFQFFSFWKTVLLPSYNELIGHFSSMSDHTLYVFLKSVNKVKLNECDGIYIKSKKHSCVIYNYSLLNRINKKWRMFFLILFIHPILQQVYRKISNLVRKYIFLKRFSSIDTSETKLPTDYSITVGNSRLCFIWNEWVMTRNQGIKSLFQNDVKL